MSETVAANVTKMFAEIEPYLVSGSRAELGDDAGRLTWRNALIIAERRASWLESDEAKACEGMREWARSTGAWDKAEIAAWSVEECIALFAQNVASELRMLGSDDLEDDSFKACAEKYANTDWDSEPEYPTGNYFAKPDGTVHVEWYTGC